MRILGLCLVLWVASLASTAQGQTTVSLGYSATGHPLTFHEYADGTYDIGVGAAYVAPPTGGQSNSGVVNWTLVVHWVGTSLHAPTAQGSVVIGFDQAASAGAGSHLRCSATASGVADNIVASASVSGAGVQTSGPLWAGSKYTVNGSDLVFTMVNASEWKATYAIHTTTLTGGASANAPSDSKGSSASGSGTTKPDANDGIVSNTITITVHN